MQLPRSHARLSARFGRPTWFYEEIDSTNDEAVRLALLGAHHGALVLAERQTAGRGRLGRQWVSSPGKDLLFSLVLRPGTAPADTPLITLAAGVAVAETVGMRLKWPNDVVGRGMEKVAGLLAEMDVADGRVRHVVLGVGLNVNQERFPAVLPQAASLRMLGQGVQDRYVLLDRMLPALELRISQVRTARTELLAAWAALSATTGQEVRVGELSGIAEGLRVDGALLLRQPSGRLVPVLAGDVLLAGDPQPAALEE